MASIKGTTKTFTFKNRTPVTGDAIIVCYKSYTSYAVLCVYYNSAKEWTRDGGETTLSAKTVDSSTTATFFLMGSSYEESKAIYLNCPYSQ